MGARLRQTEFRTKLFTETNGGNRVIELKTFDIDIAVGIELDIV